MGSMITLIDLMFIGCGIYILYVYYSLKFKGEIKETLLLPKGTDPNRCKDKEAYIAEMANTVLIYGIVVLLCGVMCIVEDTYQSLGNYYLLVLVVFVAVTIWFSAKGKKALKKYWS